MSLDDDPRTPWRDAEYRPTHSRAWRDPVDEQQRYLEDLAERMAACRNELDELHAEYERVSQWQPEPSVRVVDARGVKSAGADDRAAWGEAS